MTCPINTSYQKTLYQYTLSALITFSITIAFITLGTTSNNKGSNGAFNDGDDSGKNKTATSPSGHFVLPGQNSGPLQLPGDRLPSL